MKQVGLSAIVTCRIRLRSLSLVFSASHVLDSAYVSGLTSGSHSSPHFPVLPWIAQRPFSKSSLEFPAAMLMLPWAVWWLGHVSVLHTWMSAPLNGEGAVRHFAFIFFIVSNADSWTVAGTEEIVAELNQILHSKKSHYTLFVLTPLVNKLHIWLSLWENCIGLSS